MIYDFLVQDVIIITEAVSGQPPIAPSTRQDVEGIIGTQFFVREQSGIRIIADYAINSEDAVESMTSWYFHSTVDGTRTLLNFRPSFLPDGTIGHTIVSPPWGTNSSLTIYLRRDLRQEILEIPATFQPHEGFFTFRVSQYKFISS